MAATLVNSATKLARGRPTKLGTLTGLNVGVVFSVGSVGEFSAKKLSIQVPTGTVTTAALEVSLDGGATWVVLPAAQTLTLTGQITGDTAAVFGATYDVSGLGGALFHFGVTAGTITASDVWALTD